jgi:hypothetical protein
MLLLVSTTDKIQLITGAAVTVDVHASFMDYNGSTVTTGRKNTAITTAATTDIVASPGAGVSRNVKTLNIRNKGTSPVVITVVHTDGTTAVELKKVNLSPGRCLEYVEGVGWSLMIQPLKLSQNQLTAAVVTQYTVPTDMVTELTEALFMNNDTVERTATLHLVPSGSAAGATNIFLDAIPIGPGQTVIIGFEDVYLNAGDFIAALASAASQVNLHLSGKEHA